MNKKLKKKYQTNKQVIPLLVLTFFSILTLITFFIGTVEINGELHNFSLTEKHRGAFIALTINFATYFFFP
ncbi:MAG: hypothetical protein H7Y04_14020 [Verrucomicrobia bacterium]|nr:hypothetical protein [Cytophagales bacterium]